MPKTGNRKGKWPTHHHRVRKQHQKDDENAILCHLSAFLIRATNPPLASTLSKTISYTCFQINSHAVPNHTMARSRSSSSATTNPLTLHSWIPESLPLPSRTLHLSPLAHP